MVGKTFTREAIVAATVRNNMRAGIVPGPQPWRWFRRIGDHYEHYGPCSPAEARLFLDMLAATSVQTELYPTQDGSCQLIEPAKKDF